MAFESFITWRIARSKGQGFIALIVRIATVAIALSPAVMVVASSLIGGFQEKITDKVYGFLGHVIVQPIDTAFFVRYRISWAPPRRIHAFC